MVDQLKFNRPTTYLELLHQKKRREQRNLQGGDPEVEADRPKDLDLPRDHTVAPYRGLKGSASGDPADLSRHRAPQPFTEDESSHTRDFASFGTLCPKVMDTWSKPSSSVWVCARRNAPRPTSAPPQRPSVGTNSGAAGAATTRPAVFRDDAGSSSMSSAGPASRAAAGQTEAYASSEGGWTETAASSAQRRAPAPERQPETERQRPKPSGRQPCLPAQSARQPTSSRQQASQQSQQQQRRRQPYQAPRVPHLHASTRTEQPPPPPPPQGQQAPLRAQPVRAQPEQHPSTRLAADVHTHPQATVGRDVTFAQHDAPSSSFSAAEYYAPPPPLPPPPAPPPPPPPAELCSFGVQTEAPPKLRKAPCAQCAAKDSERVTLLRELSRTDRDWRQMVLLLEQQLGEARSRIGDLEAVVRRQNRQLVAMSSRAKSGVTMPMQMAPVSSEMGGVRVEDGSSGWQGRDGGPSRGGGGRGGGRGGGGGGGGGGPSGTGGSNASGGGGVHGSGGAVDGGSSVGSGGSGMDGGSTAGAPAAMSDGGCSGSSGGVGACGMCLNAHVPVYAPGETSTLYPPPQRMCAWGTTSDAESIVGDHQLPLPPPPPLGPGAAADDLVRSSDESIAQHAHAAMQRVADRSQPRRVEQAIHAPRPAASRAGGAEDPNGGVAAGFYDAALAAVPTGALTSCARANAATAAVAAADRAAADAANAAAAAAAASVAATDAAMALAGPPTPSVDEAFPTGRSGGRSGGAGCGGVGGGDANHAATHPASPPRVPLPRPPAGAPATDPALALAVPSRRRAEATADVVSSYSRQADTAAPQVPTDHQYHPQYPQRSSLPTAVITPGVDVNTLTAQLQTGHGISDTEATGPLASGTSAAALLAEAKAALRGTREPLRVRSTQELLGEGR